ncbi:hypothetical protein ACIRTB_23895 [Streptomyces sp. NPDC101158]|uniref:hypothetical protein n=1 Tax=Streptomyces sp. NPDC101158 TaxID=3366117 RepID=UPI003819E299
MFLYDVTTAVQPCWSIARDTEIEHDVILPEVPFLGSEQSGTTTNPPIPQTGVTLEPAGGSPGPTTTPLALVAFPAA